MAKAREGGERSYARSLREYARGIVGGLLFSLPLLYTMEVWWAGFIARPFNLLLYLSVGFLLLFGYNRYAGLHKDASWLEVGFEAVEEMGLGILVAAGILWLLGQIDGTMPLNEIMGKTVVEAVTVAIGVSVGSAQLATGGEGKDEGGMEGDDSPAQGVISQVALGACGAVLFASNVAPTEEIVLIAIESSPWKILGLALLSLAIAAVILFYSDFTGSDRIRRGDGDGPGTMALRTAVNYAVALAASAFILWFFGRFDGMSFSVCMAQTVALGVAASLGASAGRLLLQA